MHDRRLATGEDLYAAAERFAFTAKRLVALPEREQKRKARPAWLSLRFGKVELARPRKTRDRNLPESVSLTLVEVVERDAPTGTEAVHWRLLPTPNMACNNAPRPPPLPILPSPRRRFGVVLKLNSLVSWRARTCRPLTA